MAKFNNMSTGRQRAYAIMLAVHNTIEKILEMSFVELSSYIDVQYKEYRANGHEFQRMTISTMIKKTNRLVKATLRECEE